MASGLGLPKAYLNQFGSRCFDRSTVAALVAALLANQGPLPVCKCEGDRQFALAKSVSKVYLFVTVGPRGALSPRHYGENFNMAITSDSQHHVATSPGHSASNQWSSGKTAIVTIAVGLTFCTAFVMLCRFLFVLL